ncbi:MAG: amidophosphoribosyltransferase [Clostridia bacterium]|nr:amidophosphoribosyltransferase [Clostridia bacterium]
MGGFFGAISRRDIVLDVFFGTDYHTHLGIRRGGMACISPEIGFQRSIHNIENTPFRTKFEGILSEMKGNACIGCISDTDPQPMLIHSHLGVYAITTVGIINNLEVLAKRLLAQGAHFDAMTGGRINTTELVAALIDCEDSFENGIRHAQSVIEGTCSILILTERDGLIAARDRLGRLPVLLGSDNDGICVSFESFAYQKLGYSDLRELGPGEVVRVTAEGVEQLSPPLEQMRICSFLWSYYGYPGSCYEGKSVEVMRNINGSLLAKDERQRGTLPDLDYVCGVPDSGVAHAIGFANESGIPYARPFVKYTPTWPRSFMPGSPSVRNRVAKMKLVPVRQLIEDRRLLFVDDSIVRGTQLRETVNFLYENGAKELHMRSACPPVMYACKYLNFTRNTSDLELITRRTIEELEGKEGLSHLDEYADGSSERGRAMCSSICAKLRFATLEFQSLPRLVEAIGLPETSLCTYCWSGKD